MLTFNFHCRRGNAVDLSLQGQRALEFDGEAVLQVGQSNHIIAIFVGTLMKTYKENFKFLSGTSACNWYINQNDIFAIKNSKERKSFMTCFDINSIKKYST